MYYGISCKFCGQYITFNNAIRSRNGKKKPLNLDQSIHYCHCIFNINRKIPKNNYERGHQTFISDFCCSSATHESIGRISKGRSSYEVSEYPLNGIWKIGANLFFLIDRSIVNKLEINENDTLIDDQKVTETGEILIKLGHQNK